MTIEELQVLITANTKQLQKEIAKTNTTVAGLQKTADKTSAGFMSSFRTLRNGIVALGIGKVIKDSIMSGMNAIESDNLFETSLDNMADEVRAWSDEVGDALGLNAVAMRKNTGVIYNMTTSMGLAEDNALKMSKGITLLTEDMASFYNLDSTEAFNKLRAGLTGETEPLKALGILVDENTIKQVAYQQGIAQTGAELTQQQKVLARYVAILMQTGNAQGDLARTIDSPANQLRILKNQIAQCGMAFGNLLLPVIKAVLPYITAFFKIVTMGLNALGKFLGITKDTSNVSSGFGGIADSVGDVSDGVGKVNKGLGGVGDGLDDANKKAKKLKGTLASFDEMNVLQDNSTDSSSASGQAGDIGMGSGGAIGGVGLDGLFELGEYDAKLDGLKSKVDEIVESMKTKFSDFKNILVDIWNSEPIQAFAGAVTTYGQFIWDYWSQMGLTLQENISMTWENIRGNVSTALDNMTLLWTMFWTDVDAGIKQWGQPIIDGVKGVFNSIWKDAVDPAVQLITKVWADFSGILVDLWNEHGKKLIDNIGEFVTTTIKLFQRIWDDIIEPIITPFLEMLSWLWDKHLKKMIKNVGDFVNELVNFCLELYNEFIAPLIHMVIDVLAPIWTSAWQLICGVAGTLIGVICDIIGGIARVLSGIMDFIMGVFTGDWKRAWGGIKDIFGGIWNALSGVVKGVINLIIDVINSMIAGINKVQFDVPDWVPVLGGKHVGLKVPKIPKLAQGGIVTKPTVAQIGEAGKEAVLPLDKNLGYLDKLADKINTKGNGQPTQIIVKLGEDTIFDKFIDYTKDKSFETNGEVFSL
ncbi:hypothetical protein IJE86_01280 [bacterium]|nr:hypothetical protein [bacterium]